MPQYCSFPFREEGFKPCYTQRAEMVFQLAKDVAREFRHAEVYPAHILLGLIQEEFGLSAKILKNRGFSAERIKTAILGWGFGEFAFLPANLTWTDPARFVSQMAQAEAVALDHNYVGAEHILLAMTQIEANRWLHLASAGAIADIRQEVLNLLGHGEEKPKEKPTHEEILQKVFAIRDAVEELAKALRGA
mgnify:CR=1 FL=1